MTNGEAMREAIERVKLMASGDATWDLSPNDIAALKLVLATLAAPVQAEVPPNDLAVGIARAAVTHSREPASGHAGSAGSPNAVPAEVNDGTIRVSTGGDMDSRPALGERDSGGPKQIAVQAEVGAGELVAMRQRIEILEEQLRILRAARPDVAGKP